MGGMISTPKFRIPRKLFDKALGTFSGRLLWHERIRKPITWEERQWVVTSMMLSHSHSWANLYEVVPLREWVGEVFIFGCYDEQWMEERERSGLFWSGVMVQVQGGAEQFVLSNKVHWIRERPPKPPSRGQVR